MLWGKSECWRSAVRHNFVMGRIFIQLLLSALFLGASFHVSVAESAAGIVEEWPNMMLEARRQWKSASKDKKRETIERLRGQFPWAWDWMMQDFKGGPLRWFEGADSVDLEKSAIGRVLEELGAAGAEFRVKYEQLASNGVPNNDAAWLTLYAEAAQERRRHRLATVLSRAPRIVFAKYRTIRPSFFAYTEGQSDAQHERHFLPGSVLCLLEMDGIYGKTRILLEDRTGAIRDPAVSYDARTLLFARKKALNEDDYHIYAMEMETGKIRQITSGLGVADYEPAWLPNGDIVFASTRCVQTVDCWWTEVSNIYTCDSEGRFLRRLGVDQVHAIYPTVLDDGRILYTRWDYNDRGQIFPQALFQMNMDGTGQTEFYGNNSWFPTTLAHARGIPGSHKVVCIFTGHHATQAGKLGLIDPALGRQENQGAQLIAPIRETPAERIDAYGQRGELFQYPYPLNEREFLVAYAPEGWEEGRRGDARFGIYYVDLDGRRELLVEDEKLPCHQPVPVAPRPLPPVRPGTVDYRQKTGVFYLQDVYAGPGLAGVPRGVIKKIRVIGLEFRAAGIGNNHSRGPGGGALISTPIAIGNGSWDVKVLLGDATVYDDGSASFVVPARTPLYFQALDEKGRAVQTMRSWSTLQPGEIASCVGCHEHKNTAPPALPTIAQRRGPQELAPFYGPARGFSFQREIQPILDARCVNCHQDRDEARKLMQSKYNSKPSGTPNAQRAFSLSGAGNPDRMARRQWSDAYLMLTASVPDAQGAYIGNVNGQWVRWIGSQSVPGMLPPYYSGSTKSPLMDILEKGHYGVVLVREELEKIACWIDLFVPFCGDYEEANLWSQDEAKKYRHYLEKRRRLEAEEAKNIEALIRALAAGERERVNGGY